MNSNNHGGLRGGHRPDCPCPACKSKRGERPLTGIRVQVIMAGAPAKALQKIATERGLSLGAAAKELLLEVLFTKTK